MQLRKSSGVLVLCMAILSASAPALSKDSKSDCPGPGCPDPKSEYKAAASAAKVEKATPQRKAAKKNEKSAKEAK